MICLSALVLGNTTVEEIDEQKYQTFTVKNVRGNVSDIH